MNRFVAIVSLLSFAAFGDGPSPVTKTRLGSLHPREGIVVTDIDLTGHVPARAETVGTDRMWTDATGVVWCVVREYGPWRHSFDGDVSVKWWFWGEDQNGETGWVGGARVGGRAGMPRVRSKDPDAVSVAWGDGSVSILSTRSVSVTTVAVDRVSYASGIDAALTNLAGAVNYKADTTNVYTKAEVDEKVKNSVVKDAENVVTRSFSIKYTFGNQESSMSFGENDPSGPSIVVNKLYSTAPSSFFSGSISLIPSSGEKTSLLSRIKEYSGAKWDARQEVESIVSSAMLPTDPTFSNAVLAVGLNIDTNSVAVLNEIASTFGDFPIEGTATTVGGLLAALAAAVAWLRKQKIDKLTVTGMSKEVTADGGVAKLDDFFTGSNSLLNGRLAYSRNATGLKDRAFNTLSFDGTEYNLSTALAAVTPTASGQPRDLLIVATATAATTISFTAGTIKGDKPTIDGSGTWLITLTEYASGVWYCRQIKMEDAA